MRINSIPDVKFFLIIKMCYMHNEWYDISCSTLYIIHRAFPIYSFLLFSLNLIVDICFCVYIKLDVAYFV